MLKIEELFIKEIIEEVERLKIYWFRDEKTWAFACSNQILLRRELDKIESYYHREIKYEFDKEQFEYSLTQIAYQILIESLTARLRLILIDMEKAQKEFDIFKSHDIVLRFSAMKLAPEDIQKELYTELLIDYPDLDYTLNQDHILEAISGKILPVLRPIKRGDAFQPIDPIRILSVATSSNLIMMNHQYKFKIEMINVMYDVLIMKYIDCSYDVFTRHFIENNTPMVKIQWKQIDRSLAVFLYWLDYYSIISVSHFADVAVEHFYNQKGKAFVAQTVKVSKAQGSIEKYPELDRLINRLREIKDSN